MTQAFCQQFWQHKLCGFLENSLWQAAGSAITSAEAVRQSLRCLEARDVSDRTHPLEFLVPPAILDCADAQKVFWWFWRCFPQAIANANHANANPVSAQAGGLASDSQFDVNWDWSHASVSAALAGARAGYLATRSPGSTLNPPERRSQPHLALFKFTPVFDLLQTSQTEQEIWAGSWISHYLAAKICWRIARKYGPDTFLSPYLYAHSWIDYWLLQQYPDFGQWITTPTAEARMQSQFPNTLMMILPDNGTDPNVAKHHPVWATMIYAEQTLKQEWLALSHQIVTTLHTPQIERQMGDLKRKEQWLESSWQPYWVALPIPDDRTSASQDASELAKSNPTAIIPSKPTHLTSAHSSPVQASLLQQAHSCLQRLEHSKLWKLPTLFSCYSVDAATQAGKALEAHQNLEQESHQGVHQTINQLIQHKLPSILPDLIASESKEWRHCTELPAFQWRVLALINWRQAATEQHPDAVAELTATAAFNHALLTFSQHHLLGLMQRHQAQLLWSTPGCLLASLPLQGWQDWVWDLQQAW
ncbi:MAG TPA: type III-B CRISPR-associated protein Cas10/Cmr2, partial [Allocoleopsis sp.]